MYHSALVSGHNAMNFLSIWLNNEFNDGKFTSWKTEKYTYSLYNCTLYTPMW